MQMGRSAGFTHLKAGVALFSNLSFIYAFTVRGFPTQSNASSKEFGFETFVAGMHPALRKLWLKYQARSQNVESVELVALDDPEYWPKCSFAYNTLPKNCIRILVLLPATFDEPLRGGLDTRPLSSSPQYV